MNTLRLERKLLNLSILKMADGILFLSVVYMHCLLPKSISAIRRRPNGKIQKR